MKSWLAANGGLVGVGGFLFGTGLTLKFQNGLIVHIIAWILLTLALLAFLFGLESVQRRIPWKFVSRKEPSTDFWKLVFEATPFPAFIKKFPDDSHFMDNKALIQFQGPKPKARSADDQLADRIDRDHAHGDEIAGQEGRSAQLELTDKVSTLNPRSILTLKSCVEFEDDKYIVGCYVPVIVPDDLPSGESLRVAERGGQILFCFPSTVASTSDLIVTVGESVREK